MKKYLKYDKRELEFNIEESNLYCEILPNQMDFDLTGEAEVIRSLENPVDSKKLREIVSKEDNIVIVTSDISRPMPSYKVLPHVIKELKDGGAVEENITIVLALGSHRSHTEEEMEKLVGKDVYNSKIKVIDSDKDDCINLGMCKHGTPCDIFTPVANADKIVCLGNVEYHYFAGYSGGNKALMPGVSSWNAIQANHANMINPEAKAGNLDTNPLRQDIDQITDFIDIDFIVNVVLDKNKEIVASVAGHHMKAHRKACEILDRMYSVEIEEKADIVLVSTGGFPKDSNVYQAQKALDNSKHAVKDGGIIILLASAKEGFGEHNFENWMLNKEPDEMIKEIKENFILGGHKAAAIAQVLKKCQIFMVTDLSDDIVNKINFIPFDTVQLALDEAIKQKGKDAKVIIMPVGGSTLPVVK